MSLESRFRVSARLHSAELRKRVREVAVVGRKSRTSSRKGSGGMRDKNYMDGKTDIQTSR